ncbi:hypothetical protein VFC49_00475 [Thermococcus sp. SY098]|uniref:hypothetical protein n=1 Tax=Thermococcus sp. SY098 TaxID=3111325 RepID=UPI002D77A05E|nr:hypothetical protein [Thermococcus sp. SY098]WRS52685.1 hypothetical protein VFC49_00475 [Thermococcus sp. SY098]
MPVQNKVLWRIKSLSKEVLGKAGSDNYRQKLVFDLLNAVKANDQDRFLWILLRAINAHSKDNPKANELASALMDVFPSSEADFEKVAYAVILGIMAGGGS